MVSVISTIHVIDFFKLSNPTWLAVSLAIAFEVGAAASLASLIALDKMNKSLIWMLFFLLTAMQAMGNTYYAFVHLEDFKSWSELFGLIEEDEIFQKRVLSIVSGAILPIVALGFIKSLVDYIRPEEEPSVEESAEEDQITDLDDLIISDTLEKTEFEDISEPHRFNDDLQMLQNEPVYGDPKIEVIPEVSVAKEEPKQSISHADIEVVNVNSNRVPKVPLQRIEMPTDPDINPTRL